MKPTRTTRRQRESPRVRELLNDHSGDPIHTREHVLLFACLLMLRLLDQRDRDLQAVADFEGRKHRSLLPEPDVWQKLVSHDPGQAGQFLGRLAIELRNSSSREAPVQFLAASLHNLFFSARQAEGQSLLTRRVFRLIRHIDEYDLSDPAARQSASEDLETSLDRFTHTEKYSGQFTTPPDLCRFMVDIAAPKPGERIYDPCLGMGGLLATAARRLQENQSALAPGIWSELQENSIFGIEQQPDLCLLASVRLMLAGITTPRIECGDTLIRECHPHHQRLGRR